MLRADSLGKSFGQVRAVESITFRICPGEIAGLIGSNGAGKTTVLRMVCGITSPDRGKVTINGIAMDEDPIQAKRQLGFVPDSLDIVEYATPSEYLYFVGRLFGMADERIARGTTDWLRLLHLTDHQHRLLRGFSHGMIKKVMIAAALLPMPKLLVLDEPTAGLDPEMVSLLKELLRAVKAKGTGVLVATHNLDFAEDLCDTITFVHRGKSVANGTVAEVKKQYAADRLEEAFLAAIGCHDWRNQVDAILAG